MIQNVCGDSFKFQSLDIAGAGVDNFSTTVYPPETTDTTIRRHYAGRKQNEYALNLAMNLVIPLIPFSPELQRIGETIETVAYD